MALTGLTNLQPLHVHSIGISTFDGSVSVGGTLTYEDVTNVDSIGIITARNGINVSSGTATFQGLIDANGDLDVDGHTNLDNTNIAGVATVSSRLNINHFTNAGLSVAANDRPWRGQFMVKDLDAGNTSSPYMTFWDGNEDSSNENNTGLLGRVGLVNGGASNERFDFWSYKNGTPVSFGTQSTERLRIDSSGRVMIGTATQGDGLADNLTIADTGNCGLTIRAGSSSLSSIFFADGTGANGYIGQQVYNHGDNSLKWIVNGSEILRIDSSGRLIKGHTSNIGQIRTQFQTQTQLYGSSNGTGLKIGTFSNDAYAGNLEFIKSRSATIGTNTLVQNGDNLGSIYWGAADGSEYQPAAVIAANMDGSTGTNDIPTRLTFFTAADQANGPSERLRIQSNGYLGINNSGPQRFLSVKETNNKASIFIWRTSESNGDYSGIDFSGHPSNNGTNYQKGGIYWQTDGSGFGRGDMVFCNDGAGDANNVIISDEKMRIHREGYVTKPNTPAFRAHDSNHAQTGFLTFDQIATNVGSHYNGSNGRFTVPVAGTYFFSFYGMLASSNGNARVEYYINGSVHSSGEHYGGVAYTNNQTYNMITCNTVLTLNANDYVNLNWNGSYNSMHSYHNGFMGFLIG